MNGVKILAIAFVLLVIGAHYQAPAKTALQVDYLNPPSRSNMPFSEAVRVGDMLYLSGQLGTDPATSKLVPGGIAAETRQTMKNIKRTLEKYGSSMDLVVKVTVMLADIKEWEEMNKIYVTYFPKNLPARSAFGTTGLAKGARLEMECIAVVKK